MASVDLTPEEIARVLRKLRADLALRRSVRDYWQEQGWGRRGEWDEDIETLEVIIRKLEEARNGV